MKLQLPDGVVVTGEISQGAAQILTRDALELVAKVHRKFNARRIELLKRREQRQSELDAGKLPDFLPETAEIRQGDWHAAKVSFEPEGAALTRPADYGYFLTAASRSEFDTLSSQP